MAQLGRSYVKPHIGRFIGPLPSLPGPVAPNKIVIARQPTVARPKPHTTSILGPQPAAAVVSTSLLFRARQPRVTNPRPHTLPFTGYVPALAPVSKSLMVRVRYRPAPTHTVANSVSILNLPQPIVGTGQKFMLLGVT